MTEASPTLSRILFVDIVGFSKKPSHSQKLLIQQLTELVRKSESLQALDRSQRVDLPTGDGLAMALWGPIELPFNAALELNELVRQYNLDCTPSLRIEIRTGLNSGEVFTVTDINQQRNIVGEGINNTQRVMDFGDAGHILAAAGMVEELLDSCPAWAPLLHDAGIFKDKHGLGHHVYNVFDWKRGNPATPTRNISGETQPIDHIWKQLLDLSAWEQNFMRHPLLEPFHLLLGLTKLTGGQFAERLEQSGHDAAEVRRSLRRWLGKGSASASKPGSFSPEFQEVLSRIWKTAASELRDVSENDFIGQLLEAPENSKIRTALSEIGIDPDSMRSAASEAADGFVSCFVDSPRPQTPPVVEMEMGHGFVSSHPETPEDELTRPVGEVFQPAVKVALIVDNGPQQGRRYDFVEPEIFIVGRSPDANFVLDKADPCVSRRHFMIEIVPPRCYVRDFGSLNGTFVNGEKCSHAELKNGDIISAGQTRFRVSIAAEKVSGSIKCSRCGELFYAGRLREEAGGVCPACISEIELEKENKFARTCTPVMASCHKCGTDVGEHAASDGKGLALSQTAIYLCRSCFAQTPGAGTFHRAGSFQLMKELGKGGMGAVYLAWNPSTCRLGALKKILLPEPDETLARRFVREMRIMSGLEHPNLVKIFEDGVDNGVPFFVSEYLEGGCLSRYFARKGGRLNVEEAIALTSGILDGLQYFHASGHIHRDIKPSNILLTAHDANSYMKAKIADFGLAKSFVGVGGTRLTRPSEFAGSLYYTPPEQILNFSRVGPAADIYSAGVTLYQLLTGKLPYDFNTGSASQNIKDSMLTVLEEPIIPVQKRCSDIPAGLAEIVEKAIFKDPKGRFQSAREFKDALQQFAGSVK